MALWILGLAAATHFGGWAALIGGVGHRQSARAMDGTDTSLDHFYWEAVILRAVRFGESPGKNAMKSQIIARRRFWLPFLCSLPCSGVPVASSPRRI